MAQKLKATQFFVLISRHLLVGEIDMLVELSNLVIKYFFQFSALFWMLEAAEYG
jgi:hypothetical protein